MSVGEHGFGTIGGPAEIAAAPGGVCAPDGIRAAGVAAGLRKSGRADLAVVDAGAVVTAAGVQTRNQVVAAPVQVTAEHLRDGAARAVVLNSGQANACTGPAGLATSQRTAGRLAALLGCQPAEVLVCSTGVIGVPIDEALLLAGLDDAVQGLSRNGGSEAAAAILTTDTVAKETAVEVRDGDAAAVIGGMAKGSGMIAPGMATMLAVVTTDARLDGEAAQRLLATAVDRTFNRISVDGCMSTNDAVLLLATGTSEAAPSEAALLQGLTEVCAQLASAIVHDGEGADHVVELRVVGARDETDALAVARAVADSVLVRTAIAGQDPNWGRVVSAVGASGVPIDPDQVSVRFGDVEVCRDGMAAPFDADEAVAALVERDVQMVVGLGLGEADATMLFSDLTHEYVTINAEYTT